MSSEKSVNDGSVVSNANVAISPGTAVGRLLGGMNSPSPVVSVGANDAVGATFVTATANVAVSTYTPSASLPSPGPLAPVPDWMSVSWYCVTWPPVIQPPIQGPAAV